MKKFFILFLICSLIANFNCDSFQVLKRLLKATLISLNISEIEMEAEIINQKIDKNGNISKLLDLYNIKSKTISEIGDLGINVLAHKTEITEFLDINFTNLQKFEKYLHESLANILPENYFDNLNVSIKEIKYGTSTEIVINRFMARGIESQTVFINLIGEKTSQGTTNWVLFKTTTELDVTKEKCEYNESKSYLCGLITYKTSTTLFDTDAMERTKEQVRANLLFKYLELLSIESAVKYFNIFNKN